MRQRFLKLEQSVDRLSLRERLFLFAAGLVVLAGIWEAALAAPLDERQHLAGGRVDELRERIEQLNQAVQTTAQGMSDGMPNQLERLQALKAQVAESDEAVRVYTTDLVDPDAMRNVLEELIQRQTGLQLLAATNLPVQPLIARPEDAQPDATAVRDDGKPRLYRHALRLKLRGSYLDCLTYLEVVERLPWHLYWARLDLQSGEYPSNEITIEVHTLSLDKEWIGV